MHLAVIIPVLNEQSNIERVLNSLIPLRRHGAEVIVVDGGSTDETVRLAKPLADRVISASRGRASQMNAGASIVQAEVLLFLHADTELPEGAYHLIQDAILIKHFVWGRFDVEIEGHSPMLKIVSFLMNHRSRLTGIATGDQAMFVRRDKFDDVGGFPQQPLMEDIELSSKLKRISAPACLHERVKTSGRRWEQRGIWRTIFLMWRLRLMYWLGISPDKLARAYQ